MFHVVKPSEIRISEGFFVKYFLVHNYKPEPLNCFSELLSVPTPLLLIYDFVENQTKVN
jgi:hypothetical protein